MSETYQGTERKPALTRLAPPVYEAARAVASAHHQSMSAYIALAVERDLRSRLDGLQGVAA